MMRIVKALALVIGMMVFAGFASVVAAYVGLWIGLTLAGWGV